ncbi:MAG: hypothetical protein KAJ97_09385 [Acidobacteria bacterium]|nr:hypothetical protein [Acidobacteriota bacterium]
MQNHGARPIVLRLAAVMIAVALASLTAHSADLPDSPDGTVKAVLQNLVDQHPEVLWQALPPSYQKDITEVTHAFANRMDQEIWDAAFGLGLKAAGVLRDKKQLILESSLMEAAGDEQARIEGNWDAVVGVLQDVFSSDISKLETLKTIDWEQFLKTTGTEIMSRASDISTAENAEEKSEDLIAMLQQTTVETVSRDGDVATVRISAPGEDPEEISLTLVEGRWVPTDMTEEWEEGVAEAKQEIAEISDEEIAEGKAQAMALLGMVDATLDQLAAVNSSEEFEAAMQDILGPFKGTGDETLEIEVDSED